MRAKPLRKARACACAGGLSCSDRSSRRRAGPPRLSTSIPPRGAICGATWSGFAPAQPRPTPPRSFPAEQPARRAAGLGGSRGAPRRLLPRRLPPNSRKDATFRTPRFWRAFSPKRLCRPRTCWRRPKRMKSRRGCARGPRRRGRFRRANLCDLGWRVVLGRRPFRTSARLGARQGLTMGMLPELTAEEIERYARHIVLRDVGGVGQRKLKAARVCVVGAGGPGAPLLLYLAAAGVGKLRHRRRRGFPPQSSASGSVRRTPSPGPRSRAGGRRFCETSTRMRAWSAGFASTPVMLGI